MQKQIQKNCGLGQKIESWPTPIQSMSELFFQCQFAALSVSMRFGNDHIFYDSWKPFEGITKGLLKSSGSPQDELCQGDHRKLCKLLADLFRRCIQFANMDLEKTWEDLSEPKTEDQKTEDVS